MRKTYDVLIYLLLFCSASAFAQNSITVKGKVTEAATSEPLPGISIRVEGTTTGTITDIEGNYSLSVPANVDLTFSFIGYKTKVIPVRNQTVIHVMLEEDVLDLDEVVIVGVSMRKSDLTGAVGSVSGKVLEERPVTNINQALQGRVAGVLISSAAKPGDDSSIKIRGINTINGSTDPIYVVDGLVLDGFKGGFNAINPNDVASIEILKDASATALYGSRAANGVVLVTTKKGKKGEGRVNYDGWIGVRSYANTPKSMNSKQLFELRRDAAINGYMAKYPNATQDQLDAFVKDRVMTAYNATDGGGGFVFGQYELDAYNDPNFKDNDWLDAVTRNGVEHNHSVSFTGGHDKGSFYFSLGYSNREGMVKKLGDEKYSGRMNADYQIKPWLKVGTNTSYVRTQSEIQTDDSGNGHDDVYDKARGANSMLAISEDLLVLNYGDYYDQNYNNPLNTLKIDDNRTRNRIITSNFLNINPAKGINIRTTLSLDHLEESTFRYVPNDIQQAIRNAHNGRATHNRDQRTVWQWDNTVSYDNTFDVHRINASLGTSSSRTNRNYTRVTGDGFDNNIFSYYNLGASNHLANRSLSSDFTASSLMAYFVRANYTYADKYYLTATARYDGSSKFADGNRWGLFPSFSLAWNMLGEDFMKDQRIFDQLKVRFGFGMVGNQNIDDYSYLTLYEASVTEGETTYVAKDKKGNGKISWETQQQFNLGLDMGFLSNKLRASIDFFHITNEDLLMTRNVNTSSGFKTMVENVGAMENKGLELSLGATVLETRDYQWNVSANFSADRNKVTKLYGDSDYILKYDDDRNLQKEGNLFVGESRNTIYIWKTGGIAQEEDMEYLNTIDWAGRQVNPGDLYPEDVNSDGKIDDEDRVIVGSTDPKFYGGFATDFTYKGISLNAVFNYSVGAKKLSYIYETMIGSTGKGLASVDLSDRWTSENTSAKFPRPISNDPTDSNSYNTFSASNMDHSVQNASYLRLSTLTLAYAFPKKLINNLKIDNLRLYATGSNLFCLTPYKGYDPETGDWYPPTRMFVFGVNVSF